MQKGDNLMRPIEVLETYGNCVSLVPIDKHFYDVSIGLYLKQNTYSIWTYNKTEYVTQRIIEIRNQLIYLGGLSQTSNTYNQVFYNCNLSHIKPSKYLFSQSVNKPYNFRHKDTSLGIKDSKSDYRIIVNKIPSIKGSYKVTLNSHSHKAQTRLNMIIAGFVKYGGMVKGEDNSISFECRNEHTELIKLLLPYSRNLTIRGSDSERGQMTTQTLGFSQI
jgi:hypothetical protein